ncbi:MAG: trypsin-like peptidase domain-containing protein [Planctomycetes bacterium]|nr:trypsin-like peptidase domain-containing protein [Planctomycetota bacterium]
MACTVAERSGRRTDRGSRSTGRGNRTVAVAAGTTGSNRDSREGNRRPMPQSSLFRLMRDRAAIDEILDLTASGVRLAGSEALGIEPERVRRLLDPGTSALESTSGSTIDAELEAIIRLHARPSLLVRSGRVEAAASALWQQRLARCDEVLGDALAAVGRIDVVDHDSFDWIGTAWVVAPNTIITNRHVVAEFAKADGEAWTARPNEAGRPIAATVDFVRELGSRHTRKLRIERVRWVWQGPGPTADLALLEVRGDDLPPPIPLAERDGEVDQFVVAVGYPARDSRNDDAPMARIFGETFGVKRCAPGQVTGVSGEMRFEHDCSTLGGNSGSAVLDLATGHAIGLHFGGTYKKANHAVRASIVRRALELAGTDTANPAAAGRTAHRLAATVTAATQAVDAAFEATCVEVRAAGAGLPVAVATRMLTALRDDRRDRQLVELGTLILAVGQDHPAVRRLTAQGQIESGDLDAAIGNLETAESRVTELLAAADGAAGATAALWLRREQAEVRGLLGRAFKQRFVDAGARVDGSEVADAERALHYYGECYRASPVENLWHGINFVALADRLARDRSGEPAARDEAADGVAREILRSIDMLEELGTATMWDHATRAEARLALGETEKFEAAVDALLTRPDLTRFAVGSFRRQLEQVWRLDSTTEPGKSVTAKLAARLAQLTDPAPATPTTTGLGQAPDKASVQATVADNRGVRRARGVARIGTSFFEGEGSGFLLDPGAIWPEYDGPRSVLLLTNSHVCSPNADPTAREAPFHPRAARFAFLGPKGRVDREVLVAYCEALWSSPPDELDATLLLLDGGPTAELFPIAAAPPRPGDPTSVVGYPLGGKLCYSSNPSVLGTVDERLLSYDAHTEPGMSGSPVVDSEWQLIGLHRHHLHAERRNGGVRIDRILTAIRAALLPVFGPQGPPPYLEPDA